MPGISVRLYMSNGRMYTQHAVTEWLLESALGWISVSILVKMGMYKKEP